MQIEIRSPYDNSLISTINQTSKDDVFNALQQSYNLYKNRELWLKPHQRITILNNLIPLLKQKENDFATLIAKEGGKPLSDAKIEVARAINGIEIAIGELKNVMRGEEIPMGYSKSSENKIAFTTYEPIGVVVALSAFNHPLNLIVHQVIPAIAVGCPIIVKPAVNTPLCCLSFVDLLYKAGLPQSWCKAIVCSREVAEELVCDSKVAFVSFIGSPQVGWYLKSKLANGTRMSLELGGSAPAFIDKNIDDLDEVVSSIVKGGFYHAGQVCVSTKRVYVHNDILTEFTDKLINKTKKLKTGDPSLADTDVGPLIKSSEVNRVSTWVEEAIAEGAKLLCGGAKLSNNLYEPTILLNPSLTSKVSTLEIFGPVVCVYGYNNIADAINDANDINLPFQSAVYSKNIDFINKVFYKIDSSAVIVNDSTAFRVDWMPFAGRKSSGYGIGGIPHTMKDMLNHKMMVIKSKNIL